MRPDLDELRHLLTNLRRMSPHLANTCNALGVVIAEAEAGRKLRARAANWEEMNDREMAAMFAEYDAAVAKGGAE